MRLSIFSINCFDGYRILGWALLSSRILDTLAIFIFSDAVEKFNAVPSFCCCCSFFFLNKAYWDTCISYMEYTNLKCRTWWIFTNGRRSSLHKTFPTTQRRLPVSFTVSHSWPLKLKAILAFAYFEHNLNGII